MATNEKLLFVNWEENESLFTLVFFLFRVWNNLGDKAQPQGRRTSFASITMLSGRHSFS